MNFINYSTTVDRRLELAATNRSYDLESSIQEVKTRIKTDIPEINQILEKCAIKLREEKFYESGFMEAMNELEEDIKNNSKKYDHLTVNYPYSNPYYIPPGRNYQPPHGVWNNSWDSWTAINQRIIRFPYKLK